MVTMITGEIDGIRTHGGMEAYTKSRSLANHGVISTSIFHESIMENDNSEDQQGIIPTITTIFHANHDHIDPLKKCIHVIQTILRTAISALRTEMRAIPQPAAQETTEGDPIPLVNNNHYNVATTRSLIPLVIINQGSLTALRKSTPIPKTNPSEVLGTDGEEVKCRLRIVRAMTDVVDVESELELDED